MSPAKQPRKPRKPRESRIGIYQGNRAADVVNGHVLASRETRLHAKKLVLDWIADPTQPNPDDPIASEAIDALRAIPPHDVFLARGFEIAFNLLSSRIPTDLSIAIPIDEPETEPEDEPAASEVGMPSPAPVPAPDAAMPITADDQIAEPPDAEWLEQRAADQAMNEAFAHIDLSPPKGWTGGFWIDACRAHHGMKTPADIRDYLRSQSRMLADAPWRHELINNARAALAAIDVSLVAFPKPPTTTCSIQAQEDVDRFLAALDAMIAPAAASQPEIQQPTPHNRVNAEITTHTTPRGSGGRPKLSIAESNTYRELVSRLEDHDGTQREFCRTDPELSSMKPKLAIRFLKKAIKWVQRNPLEDTSQSGDKT